MRIKDIKKIAVEVTGESIGTNVLTEDVFVELICKITRTPRDYVEANLIGYEHISGDFEYGIKLGEFTYNCRMLDNDFIHTDIRISNQRLDFYYDYYTLEENTEKKLEMRELTLTKFVELMNKMTGHSKGFIKENVYELEKSLKKFTYIFSVGDFKYHSWIREDKYIYTQMFFRSECIRSAYHEFETLEFVR